MAAVWIGGMLLLGSIAPDRYEMALQEDRAVEWATVCLFFIAGIIGLLNAARQRRLFDGLVAAFCLFVAGEEFSWGQRLFGFYPPEFFLGNNFQQEFNLHNLPQSFVPPKWVLMTTLAGYGIVLPVLARAKLTSSLTARVGATPPPLHVLPWFAAAIGLLLWYPLTLTGEWIEALSGGLFVIALRPLPASYPMMVALAAGFGVVMTVITDTMEHARDGGRLACAAAEVRSLAEDITEGNARTAKLLRMRHVHKRIWSSLAENYLDGRELRRFDAVLCRGSGRALSMRHQYGIDPWGSPYWLLVERVTDDQQRVSVYSFGPNRRRDVNVDAIDDGDRGDDLIVTYPLSVAAVR